MFWDGEIMSKNISLVVLAAGMGSRFGGLKQVEPMGPSGETVLDYSVFDAIRAGFGRVVFIIRKDFEKEFREKVGKRYEGRVEVEYVFQEMGAGGVEVPAGRVKPWGTGHAVWCAREVLKGGSFAVVNGDDFYGMDSFGQLGKFLSAERKGEVPAFAMVGFQLERTLSDFGSVARGVCDVGADGYLKGIVEHTGILPEEVGAGKKYSGKETVSMNCWGFGAEFLGMLEGAWGEFLKVNGKAEKTEFYLPAAVNGMVEAGRAKVVVLPTSSEWFGVTYREDTPRVKESIQRLIGEGVYGSPLFAK